MLPFLRFSRPPVPQLHRKIMIHIFTLYPMSLLTDADSPERSMPLVTASNLSRKASDTSLGPLNSRLIPDLRENVDIEESFPLRAIKETCATRGLRLALRLLSGISIGRRLRGKVDSAEKRQGARGLTSKEADAALF